MSEDQAAYLQHASREVLHCMWQLSLSGQGGHRWVSSQQIEDGVAALLVRNPHCVGDTLPRLRNQLLVRSDPHGAGFWRLTVAGWLLSAWKEFIAR